MKYPRSSFALTSLLLVAATFTTRDAHAGNAALAESLFRDARAAMKNGDYRAACPKLAESQRLDPSAGTLLNLGICEEQLGHVATAWTAFREVLDEVPSEDDRAPIAREHAAALEPRLAHVRVRVEGTLARSARVELDGTELASASLGTRLLVDPGAHELVVTAQGAAPQRVTIAIREGTEVDRAFVVAPIPASPPAPRSARRTAGLITGGVGIAAIATSFVLGALVLDRKSRVAAHCSGKVCDAEGLAAGDDGAALGTWATVSFVGGVAALGAGTYLVVSAPTSSRAAGHVGIAGSF